MDPREQPTPMESGAQVPVTVGLVGRERELMQVVTLLSRSKPALATVSGNAGMGKTSLLHAVQSLAARRGWRTNRDGALITIDGKTTKGRFRRLVMDLLWIEHGSQTEQTNLLNVSQNAGYARAPLSFSANANSLATRGGTDSAHSLVQALARHAPLLILIDGWNPNPTFARWFTDSFITILRRADALLLVVVAAQSDDIEALLPQADESITLGLPDSEAIRAHFQSLVPWLTLPLNADELRLYVEAARNEPQALNSLTRVLQLAEQPLQNPMPAAIDSEEALDAR